jgi:hypothetical protein
MRHDTKSTTKATSLLVTTAAVAAADSCRHRSPSWPPGFLKEQIGDVGRERPFSFRVGRVVVVKGGED